MTQQPLSPAAQAVRDAVLATYADNIPKDDALWALECASTVAALRAAADRTEADTIWTGHPRAHRRSLGRVEVLPNVKLE